MFSVVFSDEPVRDFADAKAADHERYARFFHHMLDRGVWLPPSGYELWTLGTEHGPDGGRAGPGRRGDRSRVETGDRPGPWPGAVSNERAAIALQASLPRARPRHRRRRTRSGSRRPRTPHRTRRAGPPVQGRRSGTASAAPDRTCASPAEDPSPRRSRPRSVAVLAQRGLDGRRIGAERGTGSRPDPADDQRGDAGRMWRRHRRALQVHVDATRALARLALAVDDGQGRPRLEVPRDQLLLHRKLCRVGRQDPEPGRVVRRRAEELATVTTRCRHDGLLEPVVGVVRPCARSDRAR